MVEQNFETVEHCEAATEFLNSKHCEMFESF